MRSPHSSSLEFLRRVSRRRHSAHQGVESISEYVQERAALLTIERIDELRADLPSLVLRVAAVAAPQFPHLQKQFKLLADFLMDTEDGGFQSEALRMETAFALYYVAKEADIISDSVPEIGYADDSLILRTVLSRHQDIFRDYCQFRKIKWSEITLTP